MVLLPSTPAAAKVASDEVRQRALEQQPVHSVTPHAICNPAFAAKVVSAEVRQRILEQQRAREAAEAAAPLSAAQIARLQWQAAQLLEAGETVTAALKRLGARCRRGPQTKRSRRGEAAAGGKEQQQQVQLMLCVVCVCVCASM